MNNKSYTWYSNLLMGVLDDRPRSPIYLMNRVKSMYKGGCPLADEQFVFSVLTRMYHDDRCTKSQDGLFHKGEPKGRRNPIGYQYTSRYSAYPLVHIGNTKETDVFCPVSYYE